MRFFRPEFEITEKYSQRLAIAIADMRSMNRRSWLRLLSGLLAFGSITPIIILARFRKLDLAHLPGLILGSALFGGIGLLSILFFSIIPNQWRFFATKVSIWGGPQVLRLKYAEIQSVEMISKTFGGKIYSVLQITNSERKILAEITLSPEFQTSTLVAYLSTKGVIWRLAT